MEERKEDPRIYVVSTIFLAFIISGGIFLGIHIFLPADQVKHWYPTVGLTLVAIPWAFWFLTYVYRCIRPEPRPGQSSKSYSAEAEPAAETTTTPPSSDDQQSAVERSSDGARHVHFGGVVVINEDDADNNNNNDDDDDEQGGDDGGGGETGQSGMENDQSSNGTTSHENSVNSRESEIPLTHNVSS